MFVRNDWCVSCRAFRQMVWLPILKTWRCYTCLDHQDAEGRPVNPASPS